jgi:hypothetical protein
LTSTQVRLPILKSRQVTWLTDPQKLGLLQSSTWHLGLSLSPLAKISLGTLAFSLASPHQQP